MASPTPRVVKTVPINAANNYNPGPPPMAPEPAVRGSGWWPGTIMGPDPGMLGRGLPSPVPNALGAINSAVPEANGSTVLGKDVSQLAPSPPGLPSLYGQSNPWSGWTPPPLPPGYGSGFNMTPYTGDVYESPGVQPNGSDPSAPGMAGLMGLLGGPTPPPVPPALTMMQRNPTYRQLALNPVSEATSWGQGGNDGRQPMRSAPIPGQRFR